MAEGDAEEDQVKEEVDGEDGQDVEFVSRVLVVQEVPRLAIGQPELVAEVQALHNSLRMLFSCHFLTLDD